MAMSFVATDIRTVSTGGDTHNQHGFGDDDDDE